MDRSINIQLNFPEELSKRAQQVILEMLEQRFHGRRFDSPEEGERAVQAIIEEYLGFSAQFEPEPKVVWFNWVGLAVFLLTGAWMYWMQIQGLSQ